MNNFSWFLKKVVFEKISRKDLLVTLQLNYPEFNGLDPITLSRWANNVTKPSLYKQLLVAKAAGSLNEFIEKCQEPKITHAASRTQTNFADKFNNPYFKVLLPSDKDEKVYYFNGSNLSSEPILRNKAFRFQFHDILNETMRTRCKSLNYEIFYTSKKKAGDATSFITFTRDVSTVFSALDVSTSDNPDINFEKSGLIILSFYSSENIYDLLTGLLLNHALEKHSSIETAFLVVRGREGMELWEHIGAECFSTLQITEDIGNCYIYKIDFYKIYGNPLMFKHLKNTFKLYHLKEISDYERGISRSELFYKEA